jgi:hypothetical protein
LNSNKNSGIDMNGGEGKEYPPVPEVEDDLPLLEEEIMQDYESMFPEENLLDALMSSSDEEDGVQEDGVVAVASPRYSTGAVPASVGGEKQQQQQQQHTTVVSVDSSLQPIARRTRTHARQNSISMEELNAMLDIDQMEELPDHGQVFDDEEEYRKFLLDLKAMSNSPRGENESGVDDSDDEDFIQELKEMLENQVDDCFGGSFNVVSKGVTSEMPIEKISSLFRKNKPKEGQCEKKSKQLRRSLRLNKADKKLYAAKLASKRTHEQMALPPHIAVAQQGDMRDLDTLAVVMGINESSVPNHGQFHQVPLPTEFNPSAFVSLAHQVKWRPPLPHAVRKVHSKLVQKQQLVALQRPCRMSAIPLEQLNFLVYQLVQHLQMLIQVLCLAALQNQDDVVKETRDTLLDFVSGNPNEKFLFIDILKKFTGNSLYDGLRSDVLSLLDLVEARGWGSNPISLGNNVPKNQIAVRVWSNLPYQIIRLTGNLMLVFDQNRIPREPNFRVTNQMKFSPAEDSLLAWGIRKYTYDWEKISKEFFPNKKPDQLFHRKKNLVGKKSLVNDVVQCITMPLTPSEIYLLRQATHYYGTQVGRWDIICKEHLPYREPRSLSMLWAKCVAEHKKSRQPLPLQEKNSQTLVPSAPPMFRAFDMLDRKTTK